MQDYVARAVAHLYAQGVQLEHPAHNSSVPRTFLTTITDCYRKFDDHFTKGTKPQNNIPAEFREHFFSLENTVRFDHKRASYRLGIIDTGLRSDHYKPDGKNLEALAMMGMIVEAKEGLGMNRGHFCAITMIDEAGIISSSKFIGTQLAVVNIFYPPSSKKGTKRYNPADINQSKLQLQEVQEACGSGINEMLAEAGLLGITYFSFETILKAIQTPNMAN